MPNFHKKLTKPLLYTAMITASFGLSACNQDKGNANAKSQNMATTASASTPSQQSKANHDTALQETLSENLSKSGITAKITTVTPTTMPNIFWVKAEGLPAFFTDNTGQYVIQGDIIKVGDDKPQHISANLLAEDSKNVLASIDKKDMIIFPAKGTTKGFIYAFTDADCGYCRKLHSEIDEINELGIEVRYLPWPRSEQTFPIMQAIWCNPDQQKAMTNAKRGEPVDSPSCENPVQKLHALGADLGINGTPAIFTASGHQIGGYLPPKQLLEAINHHQ